MLQRSFHLFSALGIEVRVHVSWILLAALVASSLANDWLPQASPDSSKAMIWAASIASAFGLFASIVIHEYCHAIVGRKFAIPIKKVTMFLFGGVAHLEDEPKGPREEFFMAIAGPIASLALCGIFEFLHRMAALTTAPALLQAVLAYLASINLVVAAFNMLPGFPLDGGRVLRAAIWRIKGDVLKATRIAASFGQLFGLFLLATAFVAFLRGEFLSGIWSLLLGFLVISFARGSYVQLLIKRALHGKPAARFMDEWPAILAREAHVSDLMKNYINHPDQSVYPVIEGKDRFVGCADIGKARSLPESEWSTKPIGEYIQNCAFDHQIAPLTDAESALTMMAQTGHDELVVVESGRFLGILKQSALLKYLGLIRA